MKNIDFLPQRYREQSVARNAQWWRLVVVGMFGSGIGLASLCQWSLHRSIYAELALANVQYEEAQAQERRLATALALAQQIGHEADLQAYLRHPWPRTQLLNTLAAFVPEPVTLRNVRIGREGNGELARPAPPLPGTNSEQAQTDLTRLAPVERDLQRLREENDHRPLVMEIEGSTSDMAALHGYVARLAQSPLCERAELLSLEGNSQEGQRPGAAGGSSFKVRVTVKFGYGQTNGPTVSAAETVPAPATKG